jgi:hypothetical protein
VTPFDTEAMPAAIAGMALLISILHKTYTEWVLLKGLPFVA